MKRALLTCVLCAPLAILTTPVEATDFSFVRHNIDVAYGGNGKPGWALAGDVEGDGDIDVVAGGGGALFVYENDGADAGWVRFGNLTASNPVGANGAQLYDVDNDGDLDVISAQYNSDIGWWENPTPSGQPVGGAAWTFHSIDAGVSGWFLHDLIRTDLDGDGAAEEFVANVQQGYWNAPSKLYWYRPGADPRQPWDRHVIDEAQSGANHSHSGLDAGDVDRDGNPDIAFSQGWYEAPDDPSGSWVWRPVATDVYGISNAVLADMDGDADLDLVVSAGHHGTGVYWYAQPADPIGGVWTRSTIDDVVVNPEGLAVLDLDGDGDLDVVANDLNFDAWNQEVHNVYVYEQQAGSPTWNKQNVAPNGYASHLLRPVDLNADGRPDLVSEGCGYQIVTYYENNTGDEPPPPPPPGDFVFDLVVVDNAYPGNGRPGWSAAGDIDGDGQVDVVSGGGSALQWYTAGSWTRHPIESPTSAGGNGGLTLDVDDDGDLDVVAVLYQGDLAWWENPRVGGGTVTDTWVRHAIDDAVSQYNHDLVAGDVDGDGEAELVALYVGGGVFWYDKPADPAAGPWPRTQILASITDPHVGLALGDLDGDGDLDVVAGEHWYERPADPGSADWTARVLFTAPVQNVFCADVNGDSRMDVVAAEGFVHPAGRLVWAEAPADPRNSAWTEHVVASNLDGPEAVWAGDLDSNGTIDIVTVEMGSSTGYNDSDSKLLVFEGLATTGLDWQRHDVATNVGVSARLMPVDIDGDGDVDFTADGNAEDHIYLWVNGTAEWTGDDAGPGPQDAGVGTDGAVGADGGLGDDAAPGSDGAVGDDAGVSADAAVADDASGGDDATAATDGAVASDASAGVDSVGTGGGDDGGDDTAPDGCGCGGLGLAGTVPGAVLLVLGLAWRRRSAG